MWRSEVILLGRVGRLLSAQLEIQIVAGSGGNHYFTRASAAIFTRRSPATF
jgi:hypothetical protein